MTRYRLGGDLALKTTDYRGVLRDLSGGLRTVSVPCISEPNPESFGHLDTAQRAVLALAQAEEFTVEGLYDGPPTGEADEVLSGIVGKVVRYLVGRPDGGLVAGEAMCVSYALVVRLGDAVTYEARFVKPGPSLLERWSLQQELWSDEGDGGLPWPG